MRVYNAFIGTVALVFAAISVIMTAYGVNKIDSFYIVYTVALLALTVLFMYFSPRARRALTTVSLVAFAGFLVIAALNMIEILFLR